jgi:GNAT superfamily N-acetyltransferase
MKESLQLRLMDREDIPFADSLRHIVGWNQKKEDWERLLELDPKGCFIAEWEGKPAGTSTTTCYGKDLAWIGMVLVHPDFRRHGIGSSLLKHCIKYLKGRKIKCIKLDATPAGKRLYDSLGFSDEWALSRFEMFRLPEIQTPPALDVRTLKSSDWDEVAALDQRIFGVSRILHLEKLATQSREVCVLEEGNRITGYGMIREGSRALYLGPIASLSQEGTKGIVEDLLRTLVGERIFWDIPHPTPAAIVFAKKLGFVEQRPLIRMHYGKNEHTGLPQNQWGIADLATG